jgi:hypothetical protein
VTDGCFINNLKTPFTLRDRILISEGSVFPSQMVDFDALLTSQGVARTLLTQGSEAHNWPGGWLPDAVAGLFGLEQNLKDVASTRPLPTAFHGRRGFSRIVAFAIRVREDGESTLAKD